ncbi:MAG: hypothetical protein AAFP79_01905 [Pseudomonadota bacterium]
MPKPSTARFGRAFFVGGASLFGAGMAAASLTPAVAQDLPPPDFSDEPPIEAPAEPSPEMEAALERMGEVIDALDGDAERNGNNWQFTLDERMILVVTDPAAGRMRIMTPIAEAAALPEGAMERLLQANFDTALDARYAIANGLVWGTFIHPLDSLTTRDFASGVLQTKSLADTFGTTFSSGALNFGGGDSPAILENQIKQLLEELEKKRTA